MSNITLPTELGRTIFKQLSPGFNYKQINVLGALYQRFCIVTEFDDAIDSLALVAKARLKDDQDQSFTEFTDSDLMLLRVLYTQSKNDILGLALEALADVTQTALASQKDKVAAATVINDLYGEKELVRDSTLTDKVVLNLVRET